MSMIYSLIDPRTNEVRYIGKTNQKLSTRLSQHITDSKRTNSHRANWIKLLLSEDIKPTIKLLEECDDSIWREREMYWITQYDNLTNGTNGGDGVEITDDVRQKYRECNTGEKNPRYGVEVTKETRDKISKALKGHKQSEVTRKARQISNPNKLKVSVDNVIYISASEAARQLELKPGCVLYRVNSENYNNYFLV